MNENKFTKWIKDNKMVSAVLIIFAVTIISGSVYIYQKNKSYNISMQNQYRQSLYDLADSVKNIDVALAKGLVTKEPQHLALISNEILRDASYAKACLARLPIGDISIDNTQKFLSQVSDYTNMLSVKSINGATITPEEYNVMKELSKFAATLDTSILDLQDRFLNSNLSFDKLVKVSAMAQEEGQEEASSNAFSSIETSFLSYPSLIYDGPFSDHIQNKDAEMIKGKPEVSFEQAQEVVKEYVDNSLIKSINKSSDGDGKLKTYGLVVETTDKNRNIYLSVTKNGGYLISMLDTKDIGAEQLSNEELIKKAEDYLANRGYKNLKYSYFEKVDGKMTINFAATENNVILYPDLVKLNIACDDGQIVGLETKNYIINHKTRTNLEASITESAAKSKINDKLDIQKSSLCVIPLDNGNESLCYEFKGKFENKNYFIYVNAKTGKEEKILLVVDNENGVLTM